MKLSNKSRSSNLLVALESLLKLRGIDSYPTIGGSEACSFSQAVVKSCSSLSNDWIVDTVTFEFQVDFKLDILVAY